MKPIATLLLLLSFLAAPLRLECSADESGTFRGKWWNYYDRALGSAEASEWEKVVADLTRAVSMREKDQRMARTYGMHFIDYFPHRELGIAYLTRGEIDEAVSELERSVRDEESAKAVFYLNRARKAQLQKKGTQVRPPVLTVDSPAQGRPVKALSVRIKGRAAGDGLVSKISVNGEQYRFELAGRDVTFEKEVQVFDGENRITVVCEDLFGNKTSAEHVVTVDREGPGVAISDIKLEDRAGEKFVRITGTVSDATGIKSVVVGDEKFEVKGSVAYDFDLAISRKKAGERISIKAVDVLENDNEAVIEVERDIAAFSRRPEPVLLAFNAPGILGFDKELPVIKLKESGDLPSVFVDRYFVEGEAFDNKKVEKVLVNGMEISSGKGKKVFFSKVVKLNAGSNKIIVEAVDGSGNKAVSELTVKREIPSVMQVGSRMNITVLPFESRQKNPGYSDLAYDHLIGSFVDQKRFSIIERAKLEQVLQEQKLTRAKLTDPEHSIRVGKLMAASAIVATSVKEDAKSIEIISRVINTETSEVMDVKDVFTEDKGMGTVKELMDGLAAKIANAFPLTEGMVIKKDAGMVYTDIGSKAKLHKAAAIIIYRKGKEVKHPVTGKSLGFDSIKLGEGRLEEIQEDFSKAKILEKPSPLEIREKDLIVTK
ncbi:MAG: hypothetical protein EPN25_13900 [Nitrospirae bacterium]|nr:MAG: hypothetical protein EPN25_13900 [Nitrospirota bacterium]